MTPPIENSAELLAQAIDLVLAGNPADRASTPGESIEELSITAATVCHLQALSSITEVSTLRA